MQGLEGLLYSCTNVSTSTNTNVEGRRVILFDGMGLVNALNKTSDIETCSDLANTFIKMLVTKGEGFDEVRLVFDRYLEISLNSKMRNKRTQGTSIIY